MAIALEDLRIEAARQAGSGFSSTCTALGTTATLIDLKLVDQGVTVKFLEGAWIYRPDAAAAGDRVRRVKVDGFTVATGTLTIDRVWTNAPASAEVYHIFTLLPPIDQAGAAYSWDKAINDGLAHNYYRDEIVLGHGDERGAFRFNLDRGEVVLIAAIVVNGGTGITITEPSGWTLIRRTNSGTDVGLAIYRKRALKTDAIDFEWTLTSCLASGIIAAYADVEVGGIVDVEGVTATTPASTTVTAPSVTTTNDNERILRIFAADGLTTFDRPDECVVRFDACAEDSNAQMGIMLADENDDVGDVAGATGTRASTIPSLINIGQTVALKPAEAERRVAFVSASGNGNGASATTSLVIRRPSNIPNDDWVPDKAAIRAVKQRHYDSDGIAHDTDMDNLGRFWHVVQDAGRTAIAVYPAPPADRSVVAVVHRPYPALVSDADETQCPDREAWTRACYEAYRYLNRTVPTVGKYAEEEARWLREWQAESHAPDPVIVGL